MESVPTAVTQDIRVLLLSDYVIVRSAFRLLIENQHGMVVVADAPISPESIPGACEQIDVVVIDVDSCNAGNLDFLPNVLKAAGGMRLLILTGASDSNTLPQLILSLGALGVVFKQEPVPTFFEAIEKVHQGEVWMDRSILAKVFRQKYPPPIALKDDPEASRIATLSKREREIIVVLAEGLKSRQIAERLFISGVTVRHHLTSIFQKLGLSDRFELILFAYRHGLAARAEPAPAPSTEVSSLRSKSAAGTTV